MRNTHQGHRPVGFSFKETMAGFVASGALDYHKGAARGRKSGKLVRFRVQILIQDLDVFLTDPSHEAELSGAVEAPQLGGTFDISDGTFNLFAVGEQGHKEMQYRFRFQDTSGISYRLEGFKDIHHDRGLDVWKDATTLFTTVSREDGADETTILRGILRIRAIDLIPQVLSMRAINATERSARMKAFSRFGLFFGKQLWNEYARLPRE